MEAVACGPEAVSRAAKLVRSGGVVVFPTDTVYGIGCDPYNAAAVRRIYRIKGRTPSKPLPVLARTRADARRIADMNQVASGLAERFWPGPLTMILGLRDARLAEAMGLDGRVAVRVPGGRCVGMLLEACGFLVGTSANPSGSEAPGDPGSVLVEADMLLDGGAIAGGQESTIVNVSDGGVEVVRAGALSRDELGL